jgi:hypothetical protein
MSAVEKYMALMYAYMRAVEKYMGLIASGIGSIEIEILYI